MASLANRGSFRSQRCLLEEADHRARLLHGRHVLRELGAEVGRGASLRGGRSRTENEGAQARDQGFQETTSASETGSRRAPQSGLRGVARRRRCRLADHASVPGGTKSTRNAYESFTAGVTSVFTPLNAKRPEKGVSRLRDRDSNPNFRTHPHWCRPSPLIPRCRTDPRFCLRRAPVSPRPYLRQTCDTRNRRRGLPSLARRRSGHAGRTTRSIRRSRARRHLPRTVVPRATSLSLTRIGISLDTRGFAGTYSAGPIVGPEPPASVAPHGRTRLRRLRWLVLRSETSIPPTRRALRIRRGLTW